MLNKITTMTFFLILTLFICIQIPVYAGQSNSQIEEAEESTWINDAFAAAREFLSTPSTEVPEDVGKLVTNVKLTIRGINRALWVLLAGISAISLSIVGIRYILGINSADERGKAKDALHKTIRGMIYGFSAILIFNIAMIFVRLIINSL